MTLGLWRTRLANSRGTFSVQRSVASFSGLTVAAFAQDSDKPQSVDDIISHVLKDDKNAGRAQKPGSHASLPVIMGVRIGEHQDRTRFVVEMSDPVTMRTFTLSNPNRVVIDMPVVQWHLEAPPRPTGNGIVRSYRYGLFRSGQFALRHRSQRAGDASAMPLVIPPTGGYGYRVVIDLFPTSAGQVRRRRRAGRPISGRAKPPPHCWRRCRRLNSRRRDRRKARHRDRSRPWRHRLRHERRQWLAGERSGAG